MKLNYLYITFDNLFFKNLRNVYYLFNFFYVKRDFYNNIFVEKSSVFDVGLFLNLNSLYSFKVGIDLTCIDFYYKICRFKLSANFLSIFYKKKIFINTPLKEKDESVCSLSNIFLSFC